MERVKYRYEVLTVLRLSRKDVDRLTTACETHYDSTVRSLSIPGNNAVLNGARNRLKDGDETVEIAVTYRQLDTLCKATEPVSLRFRDYRDLYDRLFALLEENGSEHQRMNAPSGVSSEHDADPVPVVAGPAERP